MKAMNLEANHSTTNDIYQIMNKNNVIGAFEWTEDGMHVTLIQNNGLPHFIFDDTDAWVQSRFAAKHRNHMRELMQSCGLTTTKDVIDFFKGLSLTDTLWIKRADESLDWDSINLYNNDFDETVSKIAFDGGVRNIKFSTTSPELATDGMLEKCWAKFDDGLYLMKSGTSGFSNTGNEPLSENLASQVLDRLNYRHVRYSIEKFHGRKVSKCRLFTDERHMLLPIYKALEFKSFYGLQQLLLKDKQLAKQLAQYLVFDYLSLNTDRHAGNIGCILDADTFELLCLSPIYDNGVGMLCYWNGHDDIYSYANDRHMIPSLYDSFEEGAVWSKKVLGNEHNVEKLIDFKFDLSQVGDFYPHERVLAIEEWLQSRVNSFLEM